VRLRRLPRIPEEPATTELWWRAREHSGQLEHSAGPGRMRSGHRTRHSPPQREREAPPRPRESEVRRIAGRRPCRPRCCDRTYGRDGPSEFKEGLLEVIARCARVQGGPASSIANGKALKADSLVRDRLACRGRKRTPRRRLSRCGRFLVRRRLRVDGPRCRLSVR